MSTQLERQIRRYMQPHINNLEAEYKYYLDYNHIEDNREHEQDFILEKYAVRYCDENNITDSYEQEDVFNHFLDWMSSYWA